MPEWMIGWVLSPVMAALMPVLIQAVANGMKWLDMKLPDSALVVLAGALGEGANILQGYLTGHPLPYGLNAYISILVNEVVTDLRGGKFPTPVPEPSKL